MSIKRLVCCLVLLSTFIWINAAPDRSKESANENESESLSREAESKEISEESLEVDSEYQDKDSKPETATDLSRDDLLRPLRLPRTYGIPAEGNPDMVSFAQILAESVRYVQERNISKISSVIS